MDARAVSRTQSKTEAKPTTKAQTHTTTTYAVPHDRNLFWINASTLFFYAAGVGVVYDLRAERQEFLVGHDDDISCAAVDRTRTMVATGPRLGRLGWVGLVGRGLLILLWGLLVLLMLPPLPLLPLLSLLLLSLTPPLLHY